MQVYTLLRQGSVLLVSILLAKSLLSQTEIGQFEMLLFIGSSLTYFWVNSLVQAMLSMYPSAEARDQPTLLFNVYLLFCGLSLFLFFLLFGFGDYLSAFFVSEAELPHIIWFALFLLLDLPTFLIPQIYLLKKRPGRIFWFSVLTAGLHIVAIAFPVFWGYGLAWSFKALVGVALFKHIWLGSLVNRETRWQLDPELMKSYLILAWPLMAFALLSGLTTMFDNWLVGWFFQDEATFAIFRFGARELPLATAMTAAFSTALLPEVAEDLSRAMAMIKNKSVKLFHLLFPISVLLLLTSKWWFPLLFNPDFLPSAAIFNVYLLVLISRIIFSHTLMIGMKHTRPVLWISVIEVSLNILLSFWLVRYWGMVGIAAATVIAFSVEKILTILYLRRWHNIRLSQYLPIPWFTFYSLLLLIAFVFTLL